MYSGCDSDDAVISTEIERGLYLGGTMLWVCSDAVRRERFSSTSPKVAKIM
jgi:hypothetical protein